MRPAPVVLIEIGKADEQTLCGLLLPLVGSEGFKMKENRNTFHAYTKTLLWISAKLLQNKDYNWLSCE